MFTNVEDQRAALARLPEKRYVQTSSQVKVPYTSGDYVRYMLNTILGPDNWRHTLVHGPELVRLNDTQAYVQVVVRLDAQFANGNQVTHEDVGVWPLTATNAKQGGTLDDTDPSRYETVLKACVTDGLKACAEYLGLCFRPLSDPALAAALAPQGAPTSVPGAGTNGKPATAPAPAPKTDDKLPARPYTALQLKANLLIASQHHAGHKASEAQIKLLAYALGLCFAGDKDADSKRHTVQRYLTGHESLKTMPGEMALALLDWLKPTKDTGGDYAPSAMAEKEAGLALRQALQDAGQQELAL